MKEVCKMWEEAHKRCSGLNELVCKGDVYNIEGKCPFYKTKAQYKAEQIKVQERLKEKGITVPIVRRHK